jgi:hypothetical protein
MKIWRYIDLAKFVNMLATGTLYFPCATTELTDPFEGWLPRSHMKAMMELTRATLDQMKTVRDAIIARNPAHDRAPLDALDQHTQRVLNMQQLLRDTNAKFGVSCWHINEGESAAMWQLYAAAGSGIAIEATRARLEGALRGDGINVDQVRYMDFDADEIEKGHKHYGLFIKRKSFAHEQELRATIKLSNAGSGIAVPCDMGALIAQIHIAPQAPAYYADAVRYIVERTHPKITAPVVPSRLLDPPDY